SRLTDFIPFCALSEAKGMGIKMNKWTIRGLVFSALFAAIIMALSYLQIPLQYLPITFATLGIMLAGSILGARYGFLAVLLVVGLLAAGLPVLAGKGGTGLTRILGPSGGFIWAYPFSALLIGYFAQRIRQDRFTFVKLVGINFLFGSLFLYPSGVAWLAYKLQFPAQKALAVGMWPFLPGDLIKALICAGVTVAVWRVYPPERITGGSLSR
ncbi:biotin transporter BioY, partial [Effusibacillus consociatus]